MLAISQSKCFSLELYKEYKLGIQMYMIRVSNSYEPDQNHYLVKPDRGLNCLQRLPDCNQIEERVLKCAAFNLQQRESILKKYFFL